MMNSVTVSLDYVRFSKLHITVTETVDLLKLLLTFQALRRTILWTQPISLVN
jgi:hypothetical protein